MYKHSSKFLKADNKKYIFFNAHLNNTRIKQFYFLHYSIEIKAG